MSQAAAQGEHFWAQTPRGALPEELRSGKACAQGVCAFFWL
ncbi:Unknown protein sequence [Pseudomonas amygdali pv. lachrymans]|uniref:Uncharacterized protein n=1 Tax=Pseudomonas amygdali pv. lachrymans TaxID=53707 RepID=A0ABR5KRR1_PSEAV|nr:Unknown protein sequence [Pseudomonas amygdali pv. lachrymans]